MTRLDKLIELQGHWQSELENPDTHPVLPEERVEIQRRIKTYDHEIDKELRTQTAKPSRDRATA